MIRIFAALALGLTFLFASPASAQARHCYDRCHDHCQYKDCCGQKVCYPIYRWETRKIFDGYAYDCDGCRYPVYRYKKVKVYAGQKCHWVNRGHHDHHHHHDDPYRPRRDDHPYRDGNYSEDTLRAFPGYRVE